MGVEQARVQKVAFDTPPQRTRPGRRRVEHGGKVSSEAFLRRDPALTQKPIPLFQKNNTKTYQFTNCRRLAGLWPNIGWKSAETDTKTYQVTFFGYRQKYVENAW